MFAQTWAGKRPAPKASESTSIIRSAKLKRVAEARASQSEAIPIGETPEQRKQEFQEALRKILHVGQDRDSSNKTVWTEALHLLDSPRVRVPSHKPPKR